MKTIPAQFSPSSAWHRIWENPEVKVITVFLLVAALAGLCMAIYCPLLTDIYAAPISVT
jgi:hypothetical protein